jgi:uncharacterized Zn finger protein (UPF0148 family)
MGQGVCPTCGSPVRTVNSDEGTSHYEPDESWSRLMAILDKHYPADVFTGESGDPGARLIVAIREVRR